jgi:hypothetical protein
MNVLLGILMFLAACVLYVRRYEAAVWVLVRWTHVQRWRRRRREVRRRMDLLRQSSAWYGPWSGGAA